MRLRVIDIETSGGTPSEIIEIGAVDVVECGSDWVAEPPRSQLFRPIAGISFHAMAIHHLTPAQFASSLAPCTDQALKDFLCFGGAADVLVAHNAAFESRHISSSVTGELEWICTVKAARQVWLDAPGYSNQVLRYWRGLKLDPELAMPPHRAAPDAWVTAHLLIDLLASKSVNDLLNWSRAAPTTAKIPFGRYRSQDWSAPPTGYLRWLIAEPDMESEVRARAKEELLRRETA